MCLFQAQKGTKTCRETSVRTRERLSQRAPCPPGVPPAAGAGGHRAHPTHSQNIPKFSVQKPGLCADGGSQHGACGGEQLLREQAASDDSPLSFSCPSSASSAHAGLTRRANSRNPRAEGDKRFLAGHHVSSTPQPGREPIPLLLLEFPDEISTCSREPASSSCAELSQSSAGNHQEPSEEAAEHSPPPCLTCGHSLAAGSGQSQHLPPRSPLRKRREITETRSR